MKQDPFFHKMKHRLKPITFDVSTILLSLTGQYTAYMLLLNTLRLIFRSLSCASNPGFEVNPLKSSVCIILILNFNVIKATQILLES